MIILKERKRFSADIANASRFVLYQIGKLSNKNCDWVKGDWGLRPTLAPFALGWGGGGEGMHNHFFSETEKHCCPHNLASD